MESDLISRSAVIAMLTDWPKRLGIVDPSASELFAERVGSLEALAAIRHEIDRFPTLNVAMVVHGKWNDLCRGKMRVCSCCKEEFDNTCNLIDDEWLFCPHCGAKMDAEEET